MGVERWRGGKGLIGGIKSFAARVILGISSACIMVHRKTSILTDLLNLWFVLSCVLDEQERRQADDYNGASEPHSNHRLLV
jgi:hypothetical protein